MALPLFKLRSHLGIQPGLSGSCSRGPRGPVGKRLLSLLDEDVAAKNWLGREIVKTCGSIELSNRSTGGGLLIVAY